MVAAVTDVGTGASITFSSGFFAEINDISWDGISREVIETTHMGTSNARTFIPGDLKDAGELTVELNFDLDTAAPVSGAAETLTLTFPLGAGASTAGNWAASGFMTDFSFGVPLEDKMTATAKIKFTGNITETAQV